MGFISRFRKKATKEGNVAFAKRVTVIAEMEDPSERTSSQASVEQTEKSTPGIASETATTTPPRESRSPENSRSPSTKNAIPKDAGVHAADLAHTPVGYRHRQILLKEPPPAREAAFSGPPLFDWIDIVSFELCDFAAFLPVFRKQIPSDLSLSVCYRCWCL